MNKLANIILLLSICFIAKSQTNWEKLDLFLPGNVPTGLDKCYGFDRINDTTFAVVSSFTSASSQVALINTKSGIVTIIDTNATYTLPNRFVYMKNKLFGFGQGIRVYNFTTNKWDSINNHVIYTTYQHPKNGAIKISDDSVLLFGSKIEKFNVNNYAIRKVCDSMFILGGCTTNKNYYGFYLRYGTTYDSINLMVSTDKGEHWNLRRRLNGNYSIGLNFRYFFTNSDTGYISYETKSGTPPNQRQCSVLRTKDGGLTWPDTIKYFQQTLGNIWSVNEIYFLDKNVGFVSYGSSIFKTIDGGNVWYETPGVNFDGLKTLFINDSIGYAAVGKFYPAPAQYILKTSNQGGPPFKTVNNVGIKEYELALVNIKIFPNPNKGQFTVSTPGLTITDIKIYNNNSKLIFDKAYTDEMQKQKINLLNIAAGVYYVHISTKEIPKVFTKFVVE